MTQPRRPGKAGLPSCSMTLKLMRRKEVTQSLAGQVPASLHHSGAWLSCPPGRRARAGSTGPEAAFLPGPLSVCKVCLAGTGNSGRRRAGCGCVRSSPPPALQITSMHRPWRRHRRPPTPEDPEERSGLAAPLPRPRPSPSTHSRHREGGGRHCACARRRAPPSHGWRVAPPRLPPGRPLLTWGRAW